MGNKYIFANSISGKNINIYLSKRYHSYVGYGTYRRDNICLKR